MYLSKFRRTGFNSLIILVSIFFLSAAEGAKPVTAPMSSKEAVISIKHVTASPKGNTDKKAQENLFCTLVVPVGGAGNITVQNLSTQTATNINSTFISTSPDLAAYVIESGSCIGASLLPGESCVFTYTSTGVPVPGGSVGKSFTIKGSNTNGVAASVVVSNLPTISLDGPPQQSRVIEVGVGTRSLTIGNGSGTAINATGVTITGKAGCMERSSGCQ